MYVNTRKPRNKTYVPITAVRVVGVEEYTSTNAYFNTYMSDTKKLLRAGDDVLVFHQYQLDALTEIFKDNLESRYDAKYEWWVCHLKDIRAKRVKFRDSLDGSKKEYKKRDPETFYQRADVTYDKIMSLSNEGYTHKEIAKILNCGLNTVKRRIYRKEI